MSTPEGRNRIDLNSLFQSTQQRMVAELTGIRGAVDHGGTLGDETELAWRDFLARVLPNRYRVGDGFVVDADGWRSDQTDVIIFDRQYSPPLFMAGNVQYIPAEAVYAVFEGEAKDRPQESAFSLLEGGVGQRPWANQCCNTIGRRHPSPKTPTQDPKPIPRWDVHFGVLDTTEGRPQFLISPLVPTWVAADSAT